jgi:hypothetical protein
MSLCDKCSKRRDLIEAKKGEGKRCRWHDTKDWYCEASVNFVQARICKDCSVEHNRCEICCGAVIKPKTTFLSFIKNLFH